VHIRHSTLCCFLLCGLGLALLSCAPALAVASPTESAFHSAAFGLSPDGAWLGYPLLAYDQFGDPLTEVWVARADGSQPRRIGRLPGVCGVSWLDGARLLASAVTGNHFCVLPLAGGEPKALSLPNDLTSFSHLLSPDGRCLVVRAHQLAANEGGLWRLDLATGEVKHFFKLSVNGSLSFSPDSRRIVCGLGPYTKEPRLTAVDVASGQAEDLGLAGNCPAWSPDGKGLAYISASLVNGHPVFGALVKTDLGTKETVPLAQAPSFTMDQSTGSYDQTSAMPLCWSPDGRLLAYQRTHSAGNANRDVADTAYELWVVSADGAERHKLADGEHPLVWSRDGKSIYLKRETGLAQIGFDGAPRDILSWTVPPQPVLAPKPEDFRTLTAGGVAVTYFGVPEAYAQALLIFLSTARHIYADVYHYDMPPALTMTVTRVAPEAAGYRADRVSHFEVALNSLDALAPQAVGYTLGALCQDLGRIALYRRLNGEVVPEWVVAAWSQYAGAVALEAIYRQHGDALWPAPFDYRALGIKQLERLSTWPSQFRDATVQEGIALYQAHQRFGPEKVFAAMRAATEKPSFDRDLVVRFAGALVKLTGDASASALFPTPIKVSGMEWNTGWVTITPGATRGLVTEKDATGLLLKYDSGASAGYLSAAGTGHAVVFRRPEGKWAVDGVECYGMRYGAADKAEVTVFLCDEDFAVISKIEQPYSKLAPGDKPAWHRIAFDPVPVPEAFWLCVSFDSAPDHGFFLHYSLNADPGHSAFAYPGRFVSDSQYEWFLRVHLRPR